MTIYLLCCVEPHLMRESAGLHQAMQSDCVCQLADNGKSGIMPASAAKPAAGIACHAYGQPSRQQ